MDSYEGQKNMHCDLQFKFMREKLDQIDKYFNPAIKKLTFQSPLNAIANYPVQRFM